MEKKFKKGKILSSFPSRSDKPAKSNKKIDAIHEKITNSAALNGGFDKLFYKMDKLEEGQANLSSAVGKIHDAIYDPNDGIFSKLSEFKIETYDKFNNITHHMSEINEWKKHLEKSKDKDAEEVDQATGKINTLERSVDSLVKSKDTLWGVAKWLGVALGGGLIALLFKWLEGKI